MKKLFVAVVLCLALAGCGSNNSTHNMSNMNHTTEPMQEEGYKPTLDVKVEVDGSTVHLEVITDLSISAEHRGKARVNGEGHIHMYLDDGEKFVVDKIKETLHDVPTGHHVLKVSLHNNDHTPYDVTKVYEFDVN